MVLNCDIVIAEETANFEFSEVKRGVIAAAGGINAFSGLSLSLASPFRQVFRIYFASRAINLPQRCSYLAGV